jgi:hypothetical protein
MTDTSVVVLKGPGLVIAGENAVARRLLGREPSGIPISEFWPMVPTECLELYRRVYESGRRDTIQVWSVARDTAVLVTAIPLVRDQQVTGVVVEASPVAHRSLLRGQSPERTLLQPRPATPVGPRPQPVG